VEAVLNQNVRQDLELARAEILFDVPTDSDDNTARVSINDFQYDTSMDADNDRLSNLNERQQDWNAFDPNNPGGLVGNIPYQLVVKPPSQFDGVDFSEIGTLVPGVTVNGLVQQVTYELPSGHWTGSATEERGDDIFVRITMFTDNTRTEVVNTMARRFAVGGGIGGTSIVVTGDMYQ